MPRRAGTLAAGGVRRTEAPFLRVCEGPGRPQSHRAEARRLLVRHLPALELVMCHLPARDLRVCKGLGRHPSHRVEARRLLVRHLPAHEPVMCHLLPANELMTCQLAAHNPLARRRPRGTMSRPLSTILVSQTRNRSLCSGSRVTLSINCVLAF